MVSPTFLSSLLSNAVAANLRLRLCVTCLHCSWDTHHNSNKHYKQVVLPGQDKVIPALNRGSENCTVLESAVPSFSDCLQFYKQKSSQDWLPTTGTNNHQRKDLKHNGFEGRKGENEGCKGEAVSVLICDGEAVMLNQTQSSLIESQDPRAQSKSEVNKEE
jgi:hypothetical protein